MTSLSGASSSTHAALGTSPGSKSTSLTAGTYPGSVGSGSSGSTRGGGRSASPLPLLSSLVGAASSSSPIFKHQRGSSSGSTLDENPNTILHTSSEIAVSGPPSPGLEESSSSALIVPSLVEPASSGASGSSLVVGLEGVGSSSSGAVVSGDAYAHASRSVVEGPSGDSPATGDASTAANTVD
ncbi:hypothetical protein HK102_012881, partial [Quaeritorhiza haematococci]